MGFVLGRVPPVGNRGRQGGFSLVELMITLVVLGVAMAIAIPSFRAMTHRNRLVASANEVVAMLQIARIEAVRRNARVHACPSTDGASCTGTAWNRAIVQVEGSGEVLRDITVAAPGIVVTPSTNVATNHRIAFGSDGFARVGNAGARAGRIAVCSTDVPVEENTRAVEINVSRVSVTSHNGTAACAAIDDED